MKNVSLGSNEIGFIFAQWFSMTKRTIFAPEHQKRLPHPTGVGISFHCSQKGLQ